MTRSTDLPLGAAYVPRLYGADELGVLAVTAPGDSHPRVRYIGGDVFDGLVAVDGSAVTQGDVAGWDREFVDVLLEASGTPDLPEAIDGVIVLEDEALASSFLNAPKRLSAAAPAAGISGIPVVWVLARTAVVISGSDDPRGVAKVIDLAESLYSSDAPLVSIHPLVASGEEWAPYDWSAATEDQEKSLYRIVRLFSVRGYEVQRRALEEPERRRPGLHIADPMVHVRDDGYTLTFATYPKGRATLLPVTDSVIVADPDGKTVGTMLFDDFLAELGDLVVTTELTPRRYFIPGSDRSA
jgi:hypothetical protein